MNTLIIWENESSNPTIRHNVPMQHCHNMGKNGGFYKVQIVNPENNVIETEYK